MPLDSIHRLLCELNSRQHLNYSTDLYMTARQDYLHYFTPVLKICVRKSRILCSGESFMGQLYCRAVTTECGLRLKKVLLQAELTGYSKQVRRYFRDLINRMKLGGCLLRKKFYGGSFWYFFTVSTHSFVERGSANAGPLF